MKLKHRAANRLLLLGTALLLAVCPLTVNAREAGEPVYQQADLFTRRDQNQAPDLEIALVYPVKDGEDIQITNPGIYILKGTASSMTVYVNAGDEDKVQLVLNDLHITNQDFPCIYVENADKVFITSIVDSTLAVTGEFKEDDAEKAESVIFAKSDLTFNGTAQLNIDSTGHGIQSKDDLKITGGSYLIQTGDEALRANDSIRISGGTLQIVSGDDGLHAENKNDDSLGYIFIGGGEITIQAEDDGINGVSAVQIDDGTLQITGAEGIEGTLVQMNGGTVSVTTQEDGISANSKSAAFSPLIEINDGQLAVEISSEKSEALDSEGDIMIYGGSVEIKAASPVDCIGVCQNEGGSLTVNGEAVDTLTK